MSTSVSTKPSGKQFEIDEVIRKGEFVWCGLNTYQTFNSTRQTGSQRAEHYHDSAIVQATSDLSPGDIVEIQGDYAVKVGSSGAVNLAPGVGPSAWARRIQDYDKYITSNCVVPSDTSPRKEETCKCPFGPNLGPIMHVSTCRQYKTDG